MSCTVYNIVFLTTQSYITSLSCHVNRCLPLLCEWVVPCTKRTDTRNRWHRLITSNVAKHREIFCVASRSRSDVRYWLTHLRFWDFFESFQMLPHLVFSAVSTKSLTHSVMNSFWHLCSFISSWDWLLHEKYISSSFNPFKLALPVPALFFVSRYS